MKCVEVLITTLKLETRAGAEMLLLCSGSGRKYDGKSSEQIYLDIYHKLFTHQAKIVDSIEVSTFLVMMCEGPGL